MTTRPEALRLADEIDPLRRYSLDNLTCSAAAAELRRLHNEILVYHDDRLKLSNEVDRLRAALGLIASLGSRPADEPVLWEMPDGKIVDRWALRFYSGQDGTPLYKRPLPRTWQGLTDEERRSFWKADQMTQEEWDELFDAIEAKLREKNT